MVDPGYIDLTDVKFIANENEPSLIPQDRYVDDEVPLDADDFVTDKGTSSPTASPTAKTTTKATADKGTSSPTASPTAKATTKATAEPTAEATAKATSKATSAVTTSATSKVTLSATEDATSSATEDGGRNLVSQDSVVSYPLFAHNRFFYCPFFSQIFYTFTDRLGFLS